MTILIDLDDTLENLGETWVDYLNDRYKTNVRYQDITEWDMSKSFPTLSGSEIYRPLLLKSFWEKVKPLTGAVANVTKLKEAGHRLIVVTASHPETVAIKCETVLFKYFPFFTYRDVIVTFCKQNIKGDILIDDAPHNIVGGDYLGLLMSAPHNRDFDTKGKKIIRVKNWDEIYDTVCFFASGEKGGD